MQFAKTFLNGNTATAHQLSPPANRLRQIQFWRHTAVHPAPISKSTEASPHTPQIDVK